METLHANDAYKFPKNKKKKSSVSRSPLQSTHSIYEIITDLGLNAMSLFMDWYRELPCLGSKPHWQYLTDTYTWLICFNLRQFCRIFLPCWQRESSPVSTRHENFCTQSRTMATKTHSFCYSLILEGSEDSGKRDKNHVQNTDEVSSALTAQNVRSLRKKPDLTS